MSIQMVILLFVTILVVLNSVVIIALTRQVGLLHVRLKPLPALLTEEGPQPGDALELFSAPWQRDGSLRRVILAFVSPTCGLCSTLMPSFDNLAKHLPDNEALMLVMDTSEHRATQYLLSHRVSVPFVASPDTIKANGIPGTPFIVVTDGNGVVEASGAVNSMEQIEWLIDQSSSVAEKVPHTSHRQTARK